MSNRRVAYIYATKGGRLAFIEEAEFDDRGGIVTLHGYIVEYDGYQAVKRTQRWNPGGKTLDSVDSGDDLLTQV